MYIFATDLISLLQVSSGLCFGLFDTEYQVTHPSSASTKGKLHSNLTHNTGTGEEIRKQMDFPLFSVAQAYNNSIRFDAEKLEPLIEVPPQLQVRRLRKRDTSDLAE